MPPLGKVIMRFGGGLRLTGWQAKVKAGAARLWIVRFRRTSMSFQDASNTASSFQQAIISTNWAGKTPKLLAMPQKLQQGQLHPRRLALRQFVSGIHIRNASWNGGEGRRASPRIGPMALIDRVHTDHRGHEVSRLGVTVWPGQIHVSSLLLAAVRWTVTWASGPPSKKPGKVRPRAAFQSGHVWSVPTASCLGGDITCGCRRAVPPFMCVLVSIDAWWSLLEHF